MNRIIRNSLWASAIICVHVILCGGFIVSIAWNVMSALSGSWHPAMFIVPPTLMFIYALWIQFVNRKTGFL